MPDRLTIGVEEEFFVVDPVTRALVTDGWPVLDRLDEQGLVGRQASYDTEILRSIIESRTAVCQELGELRAELRGLRDGLVEAASGSGHRIVSAGTLPVADVRTQQVTPKPRYERLVEAYQEVARGSIICGCHVHVGIPDREAAVQVLNRVRPWLPVLLALSVSSPYWEGDDTGYASYRAIRWNHWPTAGIPEPRRSFAEYEQAIQSLVDTGTIFDGSQIYADVRLGLKQPTLEFRIADACATVDEAVLQAGLCRGLVRVCLDELASGRPLLDIPAALLRAARWRAARSGLDHDLIDARTAEPIPSAAMLDRFLDYLRPALKHSGDWDEVTALAERTQRDGTSAERQRGAFAQAGRLEDVVDLLIAETASG